jgi:spore maturation protein CgeB
MNLSIVILGLSITSSWGNGHATTYRALVKGLASRGHDVTFLERDQPWYRDHRDQPSPSHCTTYLYNSLKEIPRRFGKSIAAADLVILGSYVPDGGVIGDWLTSHAQGITAFYDIDTPVTMARLREGAADYISPALIPRFDLYLSFAGGPVLREIEEFYGSRRAVPLYCSVDPDIHAPVDVPISTALGYLGTYSEDRQPALERLLLEPARRMPNKHFRVAGSQYPAETRWPANVEHIPHLPPPDHSAFYCSQAFTLNVTRADMIENGFSPSVRLFEAAACGVPVISDRWNGLETFFALDEEIFTAGTTAEMISLLRDLPEERRSSVAEAARRCVLSRHTASHRAQQLETHYLEAIAARRAPAKVNAVAVGWLPAIRHSS